MVAKSKCQAKNAKREPCEAFVDSSRKFCFTHNPERKVELKLSRLKGAMSVRNMKIDIGDSTKWRDMDLVTFRRLIAELLYRLASGVLTNSDPIAKIGYLGNLFLTTHNITKLDERIARLEKAEEARQK